MKRHAGIYKKPRLGKIYYFEGNNFKSGNILGKKDIPESCRSANQEFRDVFIRETAKHLIRYMFSVLVFVIPPIIVLVLLKEYGYPETARAAWIFAAGSFVCAGVLSGFLIVNFKKMSRFILMRDEKLRCKIASAYIRNVSEIENSVNAALSEGDAGGGRLSDLYEYAYKLSFVYDCPRLALARFKCILRFPADMRMEFSAETERIASQLCALDETDEDGNLKKYIEDIAQSDRSHIGPNCIKLYERLFYPGEFYSEIKNQNATEEYAMNLKTNRPELYREGIRAAGVFGAALVDIKSVLCFHGAIISLLPFMRPSDTALLNEILKKM